jgi:peptide/nickel transport system substrate-binding protein
MAYAIDCDSIIKNVLYGIPNRWAFLASHELGYDRDLKLHPYDPKKARELLAQAGYPKGFDLRLYYPVTGVIPMSREGAEAIASYFEAVAIRTKLIGEEYAAHLSRRRASKGPEAEYVGYIAGGRSGGPDPSYYLDLWYGSDGGFSLYSNSEYDMIVAEAKRAVDDVKRGEIIKKAARSIHEEMASIPIFNAVYLYAMKENIDFNPTQNYTLPLILIKDATIR